MRNIFIISMSILSFFNCKSQSTDNESTITKEAALEKAIEERTDSDWKAILTKEEYHVMREQGTERSFTGDLLENKKVGVYTCAACDASLFYSDSKFKSGTGWPSFFQPIDKDAIEEEIDHKYGMTRIEVHCKKCKGHLGHLFPDGPKPTGMRYCINSVSLNFKEGE